MKPAVRSCSPPTSAAPCTPQTSPTGSRFPARCTLSSECSPEFAIFHWASTPLLRRCFSCPCSTRRCRVARIKSQMPRKHKFSDAGWENLSCHGRFAARLPGGAGAGQIRCHCCSCNVSTYFTRCNMLTKAGAARLFIFCYLLHALFCANWRVIKTCTRSYSR
jgi:hypothetical protein